VLACAACGGEREQADLLVTAPRLFDGERLIADGAVAIRGATVVAVGLRGDVDVDAARTIELDDATLLPGFVDLHVHGLGQGQILSPVTTVRDVGSRDSSLPHPPPVRGEPRVLLAGPLITAPGGYPIPVHGSVVAHVVRSPREARAYVRSLAERGAAVVKVSLEFAFRVVPFETLRAIVAEAHEHGLRVTAHVGDSRGARMALRGGVDDLSHMSCEVDPPLMRELAAAEIEIVPTLHVLDGFGCGAPALENATVFAAAGGTLLYGTDYGNAGIPTGLDVVELQRLAEAGLSPLEVLAAATGRAGDVTGVHGAGRLVPGGPADVVAVPGDPTRDLSTLGEPPLLLALGGEVVVGG
jgi:imidazolonepropionase-like amidohydrolase